MDRADIALRLVEERARIGYTQADLAKKTGMSREGLRLYETGQRSINGEFLAVAAGYGIDVQYVLTGVRSMNAAKAEAAASPAISVSGAANIEQFPQAGSNITQITTQRHVTTTKAEVKPGDEHITEQQAARLTALVNDIVEHEQRLKQRPKGHRAIWSSLNRHCGVTRYRLIPAAAFEKAETYLLKWLGRLNAMPTAAISDNETWRKRKYAYIKINTQTGGLDDWLAGYLSRTFRASSLTELTDDQLNKVYQAVARKRQKV
ncbi:MAG: helix-turn-helix domain-containing protein [Thermomonas haemolytica]